MSVQPLISFKAGKCDITGNTKPLKIKPVQTPGYIYLYQGEDEFIHFCWRPRSNSVDEPELDLLMIPGDGTFIPWLGPEGVTDGENLRSSTNGRIFLLKFQSSSQRHFFWLQSKSQHPRGDPNYYSARDQKLGQIVDMLFQGEQVDVEDELAHVNDELNGDGGDGDGDTHMEDAPNGDNDLSRSRSGGAGPDATGGDFREEGEDSRGGGADGARAASRGQPDLSSILRNFANSVKSGQSSQQVPSFSLADLLAPNTTAPLVSTFSEKQIDNLLSNLPPQLLVLAQQATDTTEPTDPTPDAAQAALETLSIEQKKDILVRVIRSPQLYQSLGSLTMALRDGGLPSISAAIGVRLQNNGMVRGGAVPLGGGEAVNAFLDGVRKAVEKEQKDEGGNEMDES